MPKLAESVLDLFGNTPMLKVRNLVEKNMADIYIKLENYNPGNSVKDRTAYYLINEAEKNGEIKPGDVIVEYTSGNTGVGLAIAGRAKGYKVIIVSSLNGTLEHRQMLNVLGAKIVTPPEGINFNGMREWTKNFCEENGYYFTNQFFNDYNPLVHERTTGPEIVETLGFVPDVFVTGVGTGGSLTGTGRYLRSKDKNIKLYAMEPEETPILSQGEEGEYEGHKINGIGTGTIPGILDTKLYDGVIAVKSDDAIEMTKKIAKEEGLFLGISTGGNMVAALQLAKKYGPGKSIVTLAPDTGESYFSTGHFKFE